MEKTITVGLVRKGHIELHRSGELGTEITNSIKGTVDDITVYPWHSNGEKKVVDIRIIRMPDGRNTCFESVILRMPASWDRTRNLLLALLSIGDRIRDSHVKIAVSEEGLTVSMIDSDGAEHLLPAEDSHPDTSTQNLVPKVYGNIVGPVDIDFETE